MNDFKNIGLAWFSTAWAMFAAVETRDLLAILSAVILPLVFFTVGKAVDVIVQLHLRRNAGTSAGTQEHECLAEGARGREEEFAAKPQSGKRGESVECAFPGTVGHGTEDIRNDEANDKYIPIYSGRSVGARSRADDRVGLVGAEAAQDRGRG